MKRNPACLIFGVLIACCWSLTAPRAQAQVRLEVDAFVGEPFGVGRLTLLAPADRQQDVTLLAEQGGRALYPAYVSEPIRRLLRDLLAAPRRTTAYFLFMGKEPLQLTFYAPAPYSRTVTPRRNDAAYEELLQQWWNAYAGSRSKLAEEDDPGAQIQTYLAATLSRRLRLNPTETLLSEDRSQVRTSLDLLAGSESLRIDWAKRKLLERQPRVVAADQPLPDSPPAGTWKYPPAADAEVEPIALRVPEECLYLHFGNYPNFQWFRHRLDEWGGDLRNLIAKRGVDYGLHNKLEDQIALHENFLATLFGERVIQDVALIGTDSFLREGPAMGVLFHARSASGLGSDIQRQRGEALQKFKGSKEQKLRIADHDVSLISTPDNALRSFYVNDGEYQFVTSSRTLARRFIETARDKRGLGHSAEFRYARTVMPLKRDDTLFIYLSTAFFRNLLSPQYRIESMRRMQSTGEIECVQLARLAARAEHKSGKTLDELAAADVLPEYFGQHADGGRIVLGSAEPYDTLRGPRGSFIPVPDMPIKGITAAEAADYRRFAEYFESEVGPVEPVIVGVQRKPAGAKLEHVTIEVRAAVLSERRQQQLSRWLGPATDRRLQFAAGDLVQAQATISGDNPLSGSPHHLFAALRDPDPARPGPSQPPGIIGMLMGPQTFRGYVGAWPNAGMLRWIGGTSDLPPDEAGFTRLRTGAWRRLYEQFTLLSFNPDILEEVTPQLRFIQAPRPAQVWIHADDLQGTQLAQSLNRWGTKYQQSIADSDIEYMHYLEEQLHVPVEKCKTIAETILHAKLVPPLPGDFELAKLRGGMTVWSLAEKKPDAREKPDAARPYTFSALNWIRGLNAEVRFDEHSLVAHAEAVLPALPQSAVKLPSLPTFGLPSLFPSGAAKPKPPAQKEK